MSEQKTVFEKELLKSLHDPETVKVIRNMFFTEEEGEQGSNVPAPISIKDTLETVHDELVKIDTLTGEQANEHAELLKAIFAQSIRVMGVPAEFLMSKEDSEYLKIQRHRSIK